MYIMSYKNKNKNIIHPSNIQDNSIFMSNNFRVEYFTFFSVTAADVTTKQRKYRKHWILNKYLNKMPEMKFK